MTSATDTSPWHRGELEAQRRAGVDPQHTATVSAFQRTYLTEQHRAFYPRLPLILLGSVDVDGRPWATILDGRPGFLQAVDDHHLRIEASASTDDPAAAGMQAGMPIGLLGIELETRRRNRLNGHVVEATSGAFVVEVDRAYGNCPKYIHTRDLVHASDDPRRTLLVERMASLDDEARAVIQRGGTFFVASFAEEPARAVDVSHRGGRPGFVDVEGDWLTIPDFAGNQFFNTLGNFLVNPKAGLLFPDFATGDLLQLSGSVEVLFDSPRMAAFEGAQRLWRFHVERVVRRRAVMRWRGPVRDESAEAELTGTWTEARERSINRGWRPFRVHGIVDETDDVRSYALHPVAADHFAPGDAGMHLVLRLPVETTAGGEPLIRSYSLSRMPAGGGYRISVKQSGTGSRELRRRLTEGAIVEVRGPQGEFVPDLDSPRPVVLLSAGIGITPMLAMAEQFIEADHRFGKLRRIHFMHGARDSESMPFRDELAALQVRSNGGITVTRVFSRPRSAYVQGVADEFEGHLNIDVLRRRLPFDDYDFYLCGPSAFMQRMYDGLRALNIADDRIRAEAFGPSSLKRRASAASDSPATPTREAAVVDTPVTFVRTGKTATWTPGSGSLLELAERSGLEPDYGCRDGTCGTCRTTLHSGAVAYPGRATPGGPAGTALICCSVPAMADAGTGGLALDL